MSCHWTRPRRVAKLPAMDRPTDCLVIGAGVTGLAAAWMLAREGRSVTVVDAQPEAAREASFANGGQLSYAYVAPLAGPGVPARLPGWLLDPEAPVRFRPRLDAAQWAWALRFLRACSARQSRATTLRLLALGALSRRLLHEVIAAEAIAFDHARTGKLVVHADPAALAEARAQMAVQAGLGPPQEALDAAGCLAAEPALRHMAGPIAGGILTPSEETGDCRAFCLALAEALSRRHGVRFLWGTPVRQLVATGGRVVAAMTPRGALEAGQYLLAAGSTAPSLLRGLGLTAPLQPLKGYSITVPVTDEGAAPRMSVTDAARKVVHARLGRRLRVAGMAELVGHDRAIAARRLARLVADAKAAFPAASDWSRLSPWAGLRPVTPTSAPILGLAPGHANLALSLGQGALGFTLAMGSARLAADALAGRAPTLPMAGFAPSDHGMG